jgi:GNAT superfamily N-acetyltransferase
MTFQTYIGAEIASVLTELGELRMQVFRDFPYLYEGSLAYEMAYLQTYVSSPKAFLFAVWDGDTMVGATTAIPLHDETEEVRQPFELAAVLVEQVFYFGESILLPPYRGKGIGKRFFAEREQHARSFGTYTDLYFCAVERAKDHPLRPESYQPLDVFWKSQGFLPTPLYSFFEWKDLDETSVSPKKMNYWCKKMSALW